MPITNLSLPVLTVLTVSVFCFLVDVFSHCTTNISDFLLIRVFLLFLIGHDVYQCLGRSSKKHRLMTKQRNLVCKFSQMLKRGAPAWTLGFFLTYKQRSILPPESTKRCLVSLSLCKVMGFCWFFNLWSSNFETYTTNETTHFIPSTPFHLTQVVMHSCKREEMPMFGQSRTELPAAASEHHDQDHPHPITSVSSLMKCMLYMYAHLL